MQDRKIELENKLTKTEIQALIEEFLKHVSQNDSNLKELFYKTLSALPLDQRHKFVERISKKVLDSIHSDIESFKKTMLQIMVDDYHTFMFRFSQEHLMSVFLKNSIDETLKKLEMKDEESHPAILYHCERNLLRFLASAYETSFQENPRDLRYRAQDILFVLQTNEIDKPLYVSEFEPLKKIYDHFSRLYRERYTPKLTGKCVHVVLDIDDTLANPVQEPEKLSAWGWFAKKDLTLCAIHPHVLHPGVLELMKFVFQIPNAKISFFSNGVEERNISLVRQLLTRVFGNENYQKIKNQTQIFSRYDLSNRIPSGHSIAENVGGGNRLKNLKRMIPAAELENAVLIEDDPSYCYPGQEKNILIHSFNMESVFDRGVRDLSNVHQQNHIFYIAGVLDFIFSQKEISPPDALFKFQFSDSKFDYHGRHVAEYFRRQEINRIYRQGLEILRRFNPALEFYGGKEAQDFLNTDISPDQYSQLRYKEEDENSDADKLCRMPKSFKLKMFDLLEDKSVSNLRTVNSQWNYESREQPRR